MFQFGKNRTELRPVYGMPEGGFERSDFGAIGGTFAPCYRLDGRKVKYLYNVSWHPITEPNIIHFSAGYELTLNADTVMLRDYNGKWEPKTLGRRKYDCEGTWRE